MKYIILQLKVMLESFEMPEYTTNVNSLGTLRILESIKFLKFREENKILPSFNL